MLNHNDYKTMAPPRHIFCPGTAVSKRIYCGKSQHSTFSSSRRSFAYSDTVPHLNIGAHTRVMFQGFTGRQVRFSVMLFPLSAVLTIEGHPRCKTITGIWYQYRGRCHSREKWRASWSPVLPSVRAVSENAQFSGCHCRPIRKIRD